MNLFIKSLLVAAMIAGFMVFFTTGCTKSLPEIEAGLKIPAPSIGDSQMTLSSFSNLNADGTCHKLIRRIELKIGDQGWMDLSSIDPTSTVTCSTDGKFRFNADFNNGYLSTAKAILQAGGRVPLQVRGFGDVLISEVGQVTLSYGPAQSNYNIKLASTNGNMSNGGAYKVTGQATINEPTVATGSVYHVYGTLKGK